MLDKVKLIVSIALVIGGIVGFYYFEEAYDLIFRVLGLLVVFGLAVAVAVTTTTGGNIVAFSRSAAMEMRKTVWPTRKETTQTTMIVIVMVIIIGLMIWVIDRILKWIVGMLI